jgi:glycerol-3-phosphate O-acyltransferase/dihydroxyacetone phosphate acyltransferase
MLTFCQLVHAARRLYGPKRSHIPLSSVIEINRRLIKGYTQYKNDPRIQWVTKSITQYTRQLQLLGLRDHQVEYACFSSLKVISSLVYRVGKLSILAIGTLPGLVLFSPVFIVARVYSHKKSKEALAASTVKIHGNDVMATWKILVAGGLAPLLYTYYVVILAFWTRYNHIQGLLPESVAISTVVLAAYIVFPTLTYAALRLGEIGMDILKSLRPLVLCLVPSSAGTLVQLREQRAGLSHEVTELINALGPDLFPDCDAASLPQPRKLYSDVSPEMSLDDLADSEFFSCIDKEEAMS